MVLAGAAQPRCITLNERTLSMRTTQAVAVGLSLFVYAATGRSDDTPAKGKIVAVDLFKNGLAVVKCEVTLEKPGTYILTEAPQPVHGTFWVESSGSVETAMKLQDVEVPAIEAAPGNLQEDLADKKVTVYFKGDKRAPVVGTMMKLKPVKGEEHVGPSRFLVLQTGKGRTYVEASEVASVEAENAGDKVTRRQPRLFLTLGATDRPETRVTLRYLTHGMSWAPSYKIDISDPKTLALEQHAVVRNELSNIDGAEVRLISGYPSVQFAHVRSLLAPQTSLAAFFRELGSGGGRDIPTLGNQVLMQNVSMNVYSGSANLALGATPMGEGVDLHFQPIGKRTLADGESLALTVARGKADYERIVEWLVPDNRNEYGQHHGRNHSEGDDDSAWDALKFKNPLAFPMTTGPAMVTADGQFNGQRTSYWVNSGEETVLRVGKALSLRTRALEHEQLDKGGGRDVVWIGGRQFRKSTVAGELAVSNHRKETTSVLIRRRFSGELVQADGSPKASLREEGVFSINRRNELLWSFPLKSGEERILKYTYTVLVPN